jgi:hypothetical protein
MKTGFPRHLMMTYYIELVGENNLGVTDAVKRSTYVLALGYGSEADFDLGLSENVGRGGHVD